MKKAPEIGSYASIIDSITEAVVVRDLSDKIIYTNAAAEKLFGYGPDELIGKQVDILIPPGKANEEKRILEQLVSGEQVENYETERLDKSGNMVFVEVSSSAHKNEQGKITGVASVIRNLNGKSKVVAEQEITESKNQIETIVQNAPYAVVVINDQGEIKNWNLRAEEIFGWRSVEVMGKLMHMTIMPERYRSAHLKGFSHFLRTGEGPVLGKTLELAAIRKNGEEFPIEIRISSMVAKGKYIFVASINDITERKKSEQLLRESEEKFNKAFQASPAGLTLTSSTTGKWIDANESFLRMIGYSKEEIIGHSSVEIGLIGAEERQRVIDIVQRDGSLKDFEVVITTKTGEHLTVLNSMEKISMRGEPCILTVLIDITDRKRAEDELHVKSEELERSNKELEQFAYVASHDLQEPLRNITNYVGLLNSELGETAGEKSTYYLEVLMRSAERMKVLIRDLLEFSRIGRNRVIEQIDCNSILEEVMADLDSSIKEASAKIQSVKLPVIESNRSEMKQLFQNLLSNAIKFHRPDVPPEIKINCTEGIQEWTFSITDNGIGIKSEYIDKIFMLFQRLHVASEYPGTGIGLATCKKIVELHDGKIWVKSTPGKSTTFYFTIAKK